MAAKADIQGGTATRVTIGIGTAKQPADLIPLSRSSYSNVTARNGRKTVPHVTEEAHSLAG
jgi:hypothetical protein